LKKVKVHEDDFDDRHENFELYNREKEIEEVKMFSEASKPLLGLDKRSLNELIAILEKFATDPTINVN
jgi:hypothetical protein